MKFKPYAHARPEEINPSAPEVQAAASHTLKIEAECVSGKWWLRGHLPGCSVEPDRMLTMRTLWPHVQSL